MVTPLVSASQVTLYKNECKRKWGWKYLARLPTPTNESAALGTEVDEGQLQPYLRDNRPFDFTKDSGYIAASGLQYLPQPQTCNLEVQKHFIMPSPTPGAGFGYQGYIDLWLPKGGVPGIPDDAPAVVDFKTTKDFKRAKTEETLAEDVQAMLYATWAMFSTGARKVDLAWTYFRTKGAHKSMRTHIRVDAEHVVKQFLAIDETAREMFAVRAKHEAGELEPFDLEPNPEMCEGFGGCPFRSECNLSPLQIVEGLEAQARREMGRSLPIYEENQLASTTGPMSDTKSFLANLRARKAAAAGTPTPTALPPPAPEPEAPPSIAFAPPPAPQPLPINPPESKLPPPAPAPVVAVEVSAEEATETVTETPAPKKRGRPKKTTAASAPPPVETVAEDATEAAVSWASEATPPPAADTGESVDITWGKESFQPIPFNTFDVGPFRVTARVQPGESLGDALRRVDATVAAFAIEARANKAEGFKRTLGSVGAK